MFETLEPESLVPDVLVRPRASESVDGSWHIELNSEVLPRLPDVTSQSSVERLKKMLSGGEAFVAPASSVVGEDMLRWDFEYLREHLPPAQRYDVFYVRDRLVMSHSLRYSGGDIPGATSGGCGEVVGGGGEGGGGEGGGEGDAASALGLAGDAPFAQSKVSFMTFADFLAASEAARAAGEGAAADAGGERPYLGLDLLKRSSKLDADGRLGAIGEALSADVHKFDFAALRGWGFPVISAMHLFVGSEATCYHTHYDLNPNLHFQLVGRKRFLLFPPDSWPHLHPFPIHHDLDRRSRVNLDAPDDERFPTWREARGMAIELQPGDCLYIPPFWWHHVQTVTTPCVSMAVWCYDTHPESVSGGRDLMPSSGAAKHISDAKRKDKIKAVKEQVKLVERDVLRGTLPESAGRIASVAVQAAKDTKEPTPTVTTSDRPTLNPAAARDSGDDLRRQADELRQADDWDCTGSAQEPEPDPEHEPDPTEGMTPREAALYRARARALYRRSEQEREQAGEAERRRARGATAQRQPQCTEKPMVRWF